jgi:hypothetical protein
MNRLSGCSIVLWPPTGTASASRTVEHRQATPGKVRELGGSGGSDELRVLAAANVEERAQRTSEPEQRASYLQRIRSHGETIAGRGS